MPSRRRWRRCQGLRPKAFWRTWELVIAVPVRFGSWADILGDQTLGGKKGPGVASPRAGFLCFQGLKVSHPDNRVSCCGCHVGRVAVGTMSPEHNVYLSQPEARQKCSLRHFVNQGLGPFSTNGGPNPNPMRRLCLLLDKHPESLKCCMVLDDVQHTQIAEYGDHLCPNILPGRSVN